MAREPFNQAAADLSPQASWVNYVPMSKEAAIELIKRDLPDDPSVTLRVNSDGSGRIDVRSECIDEGRTFNLSKGVIDAGYMEVDGTGRGIGRNILRNEIEFFMACDAKRFKVSAGLDAGGYTWARLGFLPKDDELKYLRKNVKRRYKEIAPLLSKKEKAQLEKALRIKKPEDLWRVADIRLDMAPRLSKSFKKAAKNDRTSAKIMRDVIYMKDSPVKKGQLKKNTPFPLGRFLLAGLQWDGHIDFSNKKQMKRVESYVGGFSKPLKKLRPKP